MPGRHQTIVDPVFTRIARFNVDVMDMFTSLTSMLIFAVPSDRIVPALVVAFSCVVCARAMRPASRR
jgi:hypothetical protein